MPYYQWLADTLGALGFSVAVLGFAIFVGACVVVARSRNAAVIAAYLALVPLPLILAVFAAAKVALDEIAVISDEHENAALLALGRSLGTGEVHIMCGVLAMLPAYLVTALGLFIRTVRANRAAIIER
ncbi:MAG TPA: hypothetical protein VHV55_03055 [Pirellulales bacterium]|nr:hypothetical protein [Pirellulales bacterium]